MNEPITNEELDRLRAGLYDDDPALRQRLEAALANDPALRERQQLWPELRDALDETAASATAVNNQLRLRRRQILNGEYHRRRRWKPHAEVSLRR